MKYCEALKTYVSKPATQTAPMEKLTKIRGISTFYLLPKQHMSHNAGAKPWCEVLQQAASGEL